MYQDFQNSMKGFVVFTLSDIRKTFPNFAGKNLVNWQTKGYLNKLKNGCYAFSDLKPTEYNRFLASNKLYEPSYVSMESALSYYGVIPEGVYSVQAISTRKTKNFSNALGTFHYHSLKSSLYFGYRLVHEGDSIPFRIATLEKTLLDFLYLRSDIDCMEALEALRWNRDILAAIDWPILEQYLELFNSRTLRKKTELLHTYLHA